MPFADGGLLLVSERAWTLRGLNPFCMADKPELSAQA